jgi:hypothetical protein
VVSRKSISGGLICLGLIASGADVSAHHSTAMFEWGKEKAIEGTVEKWQWTQPHTFLWVKVMDGGGVAQLYGLEGMSPSWLGRHGWSNHSFAAGDKVRVALYPLRDGRLGGFYLRVTRNGQTFEALPQQVP